MKKRNLVCIISAFVILAIALGMFTMSFRKISVISGEQNVVSCPRYARPGQEVTVTTVVVDDAEIYVNGADGEYVRPGIYVFTMPDEDVQLKVTVIAYPDGA